MLSRNLKRALLDSRWPMPPTFLLPWAAGLTTVSHSADASTIPPPNPIRGRSPNSQSKTEVNPSQSSSDLSQQMTVAAPPLPSPSSPSSSNTTPLDLSPSIRELLPVLRAQSSHYITVHIHGKPYLVTQGDTVRLPFFMHGVEPGDVLRLNRAVNLGSRDYTLKAPAPRPRLKSPTTDTRSILDSTTGQLVSRSQAMPKPEFGIIPSAQNALYAPHFIPHIEQGKHSYLDDRLFVCRAVVMGVETEPIRVKEKTKRRQRKVKKVRSQHRFTVLRIKELRVRGVEEIEGGEELD